MCDYVGKRAKSGTSLSKQFNADVELRLHVNCKNVKTFNYLRVITLLTFAHGNCYKHRRFRNKTIVTTGVRWVGCQIPYFSVIVAE